MTTYSNEELSAHLKLAAESFEQLTKEVEAIIKTDSTSKIPIQASNVEAPLLEIPKLSTLIHAEVTKIGLVFKPPIKESTYKTCWTEADSLAKYIGFLTSLIVQIYDNKAQYSKNFTISICNETNSIVSASSSLINDLSKLVEENDDNEGRLQNIGIVWEKCESLSTILKNGSSGILRAQILLMKDLITDAKEELEEWIDNPDLFDDDFDDLLGSNDEDENDSDDENEETDRVDDKVVAYGKSVIDKLKLITVFMGMVGKSIPKSQYTVEYSTNIDNFYEIVKNVSFQVDDLVYNITVDNDIEVSQGALVKLDETVNKMIASLEAIHKEDIETKYKWLQQWKEKYFINI